jgi:hypothetical protein
MLYICSSGKMVAVEEWDKITKRRGLKKQQELFKNLLDPQQQAQLAQLRPPIPRSPPPGEPWPKGQ